MSASSVESRGSPGDGRGARPGSNGTLRRSSEFRLVVEEGARASGQRIALHVRPRDQGVRVGFVTGRALGGAVSRNRVRRRLREAWRSMSPSVGDGVDVVIVAKPGAAGSTTRELRDEMRALLMSAGVVRP